MQQLIDLHEGTGPAGPDVGGWQRVGGELRWGVAEGWGGDCGGGGRGLGGNCGGGWQRVAEGGGGMRWVVAKGSGRGLGVGGVSGRM